MWTKYRAIRRGLSLIALPVATLVAFTADQDSAHADARADRVVARVGTATVTVGEMERRLGKIPGFQLSTYGSTPEEIKRSFLQKVLIPEALLAQGGLDRGLDKSREVRLREQDLLRSALLEKLRDEAVVPTAIPMADVQQYFEENRTRYTSPPRYAIWRILCATKEEAQKVLDLAKKDPTPKTWAEASRDHSTDKSTSIRGGNLGFITDQGTSADGKTRVEMALVEAAKQVKDGEFVDHPVPEGSGFAVVWRRGSMPAVNRTVQEEEQTIRRLLARERAVGTQDKMIAELRAKYVQAVNVGGVNLLDVTPTGEVAPTSKPGRVERRPARAVPRKTEGGLR